MRLDDIVEDETGERREDTSVQAEWKEDEERAYVMSEKIEINME